MPHRKSLSLAPIYWGAYIRGSTYGAGYADAPWDTATWDLFEAHAGKRVSILHWGQAWHWLTQPGYVGVGDGHYQKFSVADLNKVRGRGAIPLLSWGSWSLSAGGSVNQPNYSLASIIAGNHDSFIALWATDAKAWGYPFFLRFDWEMNGRSWFPWQEGVNGNTAGQFVLAWRHVHDIFEAVGATNVTWVWCPNTDYNGSTSLAGLYPGDAYVDWTALDGYNNDPNFWLTFDQVFTGSGTTWLNNSYQRLLVLAPNKPIMLGEFASIEDANDSVHKAGWITDALLTQLPVNFPAIKAAVWFNWNADGPDKAYVIESSAAAQAAFAAGIGSPYYATNDFGNLPAGSKVWPITSPTIPTSTIVPSTTTTATATATSAPTATEVATSTPSPFPSASATRTRTVTPTRRPTKTPKHRSD
jgi:beta-mannanase